MDDKDYEADRDDNWISKFFTMLKDANEDPYEIACETNADCWKEDDFYMCTEVKDHALGPKVCLHKPLFPLKGIEWIGTFLFAIIMLLSNVGGIGGGGIAIPMVQIFFGFDDLKKAIAISSFSIFISTFTRFFYNINERHPDKPNMMSLDYGLASVMMPLTLIGT